VSVNDGGKATTRNDGKSSEENRPFFIFILFFLCVCFVTGCWILLLSSLNNGTGYKKPPGKFWPDKRCRSLFVYTTVLQLNEWGNQRKRTAIAIGPITFSMKHCQYDCVHVHVRMGLGGKARKRYII
jgi:hypothetical protein